MSAYKTMIIKDTGCTQDDAVLIEIIMRDHIFHSTLDWQPRIELRRAAREAAAMLEEDRGLFEEQRARVLAMFEELNRAEQKAGV